MLDAASMEKAANIQKGLQQFESIHLSVYSKEREGYICQVCGIDFPCERMLLFMVLQGIAAVTAMVPTGNMASVMQRFMGGNKS